MTKLRPSRIALVTLRANQLRTLLFLAHTPGDDLHLVPGPAPEPKQTRFYGSVVLDPDQYNRQIAKINETIIDQLRFSHARLELSLEIQATQPDGFDPSIVKRISSSAETLGFTASGFDEE